MTETSLIQAAQQGDVTAMERLYQNHQVQAYRTAFLILRDEQLADDLVQEAFIRAFREIGRCDPSRPFAPWLIKILIHLCRNSLRRERRSLPVAEVRGSERPDPGFLAAEAKVDVEAALERLEPNFHEVLMLRYYNQFTEPEIAEILGIPLGTVKSRLHWARSHMRSLLGADQAERGVR